MPMHCCQYHAPVLLSWLWKSEEEYEAWYADPEAYHVDEQVSQGQKPCTDRQRRAEAFAAARKRIQSLLFYYEPRFAMHGRRSTRLLDIGCGTGEFVKTARTYNYDAYGIDPNPALATQDRIITTGTWKDVQGTWDIITLHDVFEHLTRPREALRAFQGHLNDRGLVVIEQPEWDSPHQREAGMEWKHIRPRQHVCLYSRQAAEQLYEEEGFSLVAFYRPLRATLGKMVHLLQRA